MFSLLPRCMSYHLSMIIMDMLRQAGIDRMDAEVLLAHALQKDRTWLIAHGDETIPPEAHAAFTRNIARRAVYEPVAYITGEKEFYGRTFCITPAVLIPRPATEGLIDFTLDRFHGNTCDTVRSVDTGIVVCAAMYGQLTGVRTIVDVGTGSGCIGITLACELPDLCVIATDISQEALSVARMNARRHDVNDRIMFRYGSLLDPVSDLHDPFLVVSNPPYIPECVVLPPDVVRYEPHGALYAGQDGMDAIRELVQQAHAHPQCRGVLLECRAEQASAVHIA